MDKEEHHYQDTLDSYPDFSDQLGYTLEEVQLDLLEYHLGHIHHTLQGKEELQLQDTQDYSLSIVHQQEYILEVVQE